MAASAFTALVVAALTVPVGIAVLEWVTPPPHAPVMEGSVPVSLKGGFEPRPRHSLVHWAAAAVVGCVAGPQAESGGTTGLNSSFSEVTCLA
jgi:hypothetical protein